MGYCENFCQICGVSFNLGRCRTQYEPQEAGWGLNIGLYYSGKLCLKNKGGECEIISVDGGQDVHVAGPGCTYEGGYSGHRISVEEMKDMNLTRYIIPKPKDAPEEEDEADYEKSSDFFISVQSISTQEHFIPGRLPRYRYGVDSDSFFAQNYRRNDDEEFGVPVHDSCWKIFERVSKLRLGRVDLQGFMALWHRSACGACGFHRIGQKSIIRDCNGQFWLHVPGTEYLAANPHDIVGFTRMVLGAYSSPDFLRSDHFVYIDKYDRLNFSRPHVNPTDPFTKLPTELKNMILFDLDPKGIGSLRQVSREFRHLPQELFRRLFLREFPWLWEIDEFKQRKLEETRETYLSELGGDPCRLKEERPDEYKKYVQECAALKSPRLEWNKIYGRIKLWEKSSLGLRNRVRVWELAERITKRIGNLRDEKSAEKRYDLRDEGDRLQVKPTKEERDRGLVTNGDRCPDCRFPPVVATVDGENTRDA